MIDEAQSILDAAPAPATMRRASFVAVDSAGGAVVDMGGSRFVAEFGAGYVPQPGETVQILTTGARHVLLPGRALPGTGTVMTVTDGVVTVDTVTGQYAMPHVGDAPTSGDLVGISWSEVPFVIGKLSVQPEAPDPIPDPGGGAVRSATFMVTDTGSHNVGSGSYWQAQPWASDTTLGGWFYGTQIADTIPAGATLVSLEFYVSRQQDYGSSPIFGLHPLASKAGQLSFTTTQAWDPGRGWQVPPNAAAWFAGLKSGGGRMGVGLNHGGWNRFSSRAQDSMTGALRISWKV